MTNRSPSAPSSAREKAESFLVHASQFKLGELPTEARHPKTKDLSELASRDVLRAVRTFHEVELEALECLHTERMAIEELAAEIRSTFASGGRVLFCGCGATGRLSVSLETLWRERVTQLGKPELADRVAGFIAGGDYAMVRSIENFEDHPEFGARQLHDLAFSPGDLLISVTEGGETPFVIGATEEGAKISTRKPWYLFCNPTDSLRVERSRRVLTNPRVRALSLVTGPMAIAGSTRLQASTALMLACGAALFAEVEKTSATDLISKYREDLARVDFTGLAPLVVAESAIYTDGRRCVHRAPHHAITVLTDTTERSPTFSILPFENPLIDSTPRLAWTYLSIPDAATAQQAWERILHRTPRALEWHGYTEQYGPKILPGFDFSRNAELRREKAGANLARFDIERTDTKVTLSIEAERWSFTRPQWLVAEHLILKCALNITSTLVMGRLGRFKGNLMLFVKASNNKLVDRAIRFTSQLLEDAQIPVPSYEKLCHWLFEAAEGLGPEEPVVLKTFELVKEKTT
ncbi:MAG: hypothetical protein V4760_16095 [Bdellovibrionota bacterium]